MPEFYRKKKNREETEKKSADCYIGEIRETLRGRKWFNVNVNALSSVHPFLGPASTSYTERRKIERKGKLVHGYSCCV